MRSRKCAARVWELRRGGRPGRKWASGQTHAHWPPEPRPFGGFSSSSTALPEVQPSTLAPTSGRTLRQAPPFTGSAPQLSAPCAGGGAGLLRWSWRFRSPKPGARSRSLRRRPGYDRGSPASCSGQPESLCQRVPVVERSPQAGSTARFAAALLARPLLRWRRRSSPSR